MPKPLKKATKKGARRKRQSSGIAKRLSKVTRLKPGTKVPEWAKDFAPGGIEVTFGPETEHQVTATPSDLEKFEAMYRARMAALGSKGGKISGAKRMEMPEKQRRAIAKKAAAARWGKKPSR